MCRTWLDPPSGGMAAMKGCEGGGGTPIPAGALPIAGPAIIIIIGISNNHSNTPDPRYTKAVTATRQDCLGKRGERRRMVVTSQDGYTLVIMMMVVVRNGPVVTKCE
jgi:hypothetical protein